MKFINANKLHRKSGGPSLRNERLDLHNPQLARRPATGMLLRQVAAVPWRRYTLGREPIHANANMDADARDPFLVPGFSIVSAQAFAVYRMDPHVVVLYPSALGCCRVAFSSTGAGPDLYSCASGVRFVVLDTPGGRDPGMEWIRGSSQQEKDAETAYLALVCSSSFGWALSCAKGGVDLFGVFRRLCQDRRLIEREHASIFHHHFAANDGRPHIGGLECIDDG
jgi:hypothetical protein